MSCKVTVTACLVMLLFASSGLGEDAQDSAPSLKLPGSLRSVHGGCLREGVQSPVPTRVDNKKFEQAAREILDGDVAGPLRMPAISMPPLKAAPIAVNVKNRTTYEETKVKELQASLDSIPSTDRLSGKREMKTIHEAVPDLGFQPDMSRRSLRSSSLPRSPDSHSSPSMLPIKGGSAAGYRHHLALVDSGHHSVVRARRGLFSGLTSRIGEQVNRLLNYLDVAASGQVSWRQFGSDCRQVVNEFVAFCRATVRNTFTSIVDACLDGGVFALGRFLAVFHNLACYIFGPSYFSNMVVAYRRSGPIFRFTRFAVVSLSRLVASSARRTIHSLYGHVSSISRVESFTLPNVKNVYSAASNLIQRTIWGDLAPHLQELDACLARQGLRQELVDGDGNCFFHALLLQLKHHSVPVDPSQSRGEQERRDSPSERPVSLLRRQVVQYMRSNPQLFENYLETGESFQTYLNRMSNDGEWAGEMEIVASAFLYDVCIVCYAVTAGGLAEYKYNPNKDEDGDGEPRKPRPTLRICLWKQHYWSTCAAADEQDEGESSTAAAAEPSAGEAENAEEDGDVWG
uniref:OTU domain-containing protein n=1 Tax=Guillardia theta TaxID=55529 RepID=A0A7S4U7X3_GUITH|mmetsp:Transcript_51031/g.159461  ORF Transcript_51031/g.159461 Transcript_51031/m.159461 type:complete len:571 (+) Transcript_51031:42-1754(+)